MTEATLRLMQMPQNPEMERVIHLAKNVGEQLERQTCCPRSMAPDRGPPQQSYLKQVILLEAIIVNNSWSSKTKETRRIRKLQAFIDPGVANHQQTKPVVLSQIATTTTAGTTGKR